MPPDGPVRRVFGVQTVDAETREAALGAPGPSWREWFYFEFLKVWVILGFGILLALVVGAFASPWALAPMLAGLSLLIYLELLLYRYLWYRPDPEKEYRMGRQFRPTWLRLTRFGRWTPEAWREEEGENPFGDTMVGPDPREFL